MSVCKDFESYFVEQMLKSMEKMAKIDSDDDDSSTSLFNSMASIGGDSDSAMSTLGSYFGDEMIKNYAQLFTETNNGKGLGIAQTLYEQMKRNYSVDEA
jgi:flagellar protein FlgJ